MGDWSIITPEAARNLVQNPSAETNTSGYTVSVGAALARDGTVQRRGVYSLKVTPSVGVNDGLYYALNLAVTQAHAYSFDFKGETGVPYRAYLYDTVALAILGTPVTFVGDGLWHRYAGLATTGANAACRLYVAKNNSASVAPLWVDGVQIEQADHATTFIDGDQAGCAWVATAHASASLRSAQSRAGGRVVALDDPASGIFVKSDLGTGMPPVEHRTQDRPMLSGKHYQDTRTQERLITLSIHAAADSVGALHALRQTLVDLVKPDVAYPHQPLWLRYTGGNVTLQIPVVYDAGLEVGEQEGLSEKMALRLLAYDQPLWSEDGNAGAVLTNGSNLAISYIIAKLAGAWNDLNNPGTDEVYQIVAAPDGDTIYIGGRFLNWAGIANANLVAKYTISTDTWSAVGTGLSGLSNYVLAMTIAPNGDLYVGGNFDTAGGGPALRVAKWDGAAWSALGAGVDDAIWALAFGQDGCLYAGGDFTHAGGVAANHVAKWNGAAWSALGTGMDAQVRALAVGLDGRIYAGGAFNNAGGVTAHYCAVWNGSSWTGIGDFNYTVDALAVGPDGRIYAGGGFIGKWGGPTTEYRKVAVWNGIVWSALGDGFDSEVGDPYGTVVYDLAFDTNGLLYAVGHFWSSGGKVLAAPFAVWNGTTWSALDVDMPGVQQRSRNLAIVGTHLFFAYGEWGNAFISGATTVTNPSTAWTYPVFKIKRTGGSSVTLTHLINETTGQVLYFNYALLNGEELTIDLRPGQRSIWSSYWGNKLSALLSNSDFSTWGLAPGANQLSLGTLEVGGPTVLATIEFDLLHWSLDGAEQ